MDSYSYLQLREIFHIEFLRWLGRKLKAGSFAVKGGVNLRLFFKSFRYSEDMDLDVRGVGVAELKESVMKILLASAFQDNLKPFGIARMSPPDITKAKQTETTQRFKIHLILPSGEDLFTKVEFSRRGFGGNTIVEAVDNAVLRMYKLAPVLTPHYDIYSAVDQKMRALADRAAVQARDIFDLYVLSSQYTAGTKRINDFSPGMFSRAYERVFEVEFEQFRDTVAAYLSAEDQLVYGKPQSWEEIRLKAAKFMEEVNQSHA